MHRPVPNRSSFSESDYEGAALRAVFRQGFRPYIAALHVRASSSDKFVDGVPFNGPLFNSGTLSISPACLPCGVREQGQRRGFFREHLRE